jgi:transcriptional regulator with XRE-family HTH domain
VGYAHVFPDDLPFCSRPTGLLFPYVPEDGSRHDDDDEGATMASDEGRAAVLRYVSSYMSRVGWNPGDLAREAGIDPGTAGDFLNGTRWPKIRTLGRIEQAVQLEPGMLVTLANATGDDVQSILGQLGGSGRAVGGDDASRIRLDVGDAFDGFTDAERDEAIAAAQAMLLQRAREIRSNRR